LRLAFAEYRFDSETRELHRGGDVVRLSPKAFELLGLFLENRPRAVSKADCHARVWPSSFVSEATLAGVVKEIRAALADSAGACRFIRTVHGFGYSFSGSASEVPPAGPVSAGGETVCRLYWDRREIDLHEGDNILGRSRESVVFIDSEDVSRRHAVIRVRGDEATLEDLQSKNGTRVGDRKITSVEALKDGDVIAIGPARITFRLFFGGGSTKSQSGVSQGQP
jgi:DNA-binding winged helix-turn-helix (wHTH) protein